MPRRVEPFGRQIGPALFFENPAIDLVVPVNLKALTLGVVVSAGEAYKRGGGSVGHHFLDQPASRAKLDQFTYTRDAFGQCWRCGAQALSRIYFY